MSYSVDTLSCLLIKFFFVCSNELLYKINHRYEILKLNELVLLNSSIIRFAMGRCKESDRAFFARMVREFPGIFRTDNSILFCIYCNCEVTGKKIYLVKQHLSTQRHKDAEIKQNKSENPPQKLLTEFGKNEKVNEFNFDLCKTLIEANVPLKKIRHPSMVSFLEKYTKNSVPSDTTLRQKYIPMLFEKCIEDLRAKANNKCIWVSIDETTDSENRMIANFVFGLMEDVDEKSPKRGKCYPIGSR